MSRTRCRALLALAVLKVVLAGPGSTQAQSLVGPPPPRQPGGLVQDVITGVEYDRANRVCAEHALSRQEPNSWRAANLRRRIAVDDWLIRQNSLCDPGPYPYPLRVDPITCEALGQYKRTIPHGRR